MVLPGRQQPEAKYIRVLMNGFHRWFCRSGVWRRALEHKLLPWATEGLTLGNRLLEIGPGPGLATDWLRRRAECVTALEIDAGHAAALGDRTRGTNVTVVRGDATALPFADATFTGAVCFTMLHHVASEALQNRLLAEVRRVLKSGGVFAGTDSCWSRGMQLIHLGDTLVAVDPSGFGKRLEAAGFRHVRVEAQGRAFRFRATAEPFVPDCVGIKGGCE
jgi:SAM-dependent methyltransferase